MEKSIMSMVSPPRAGWLGILFGLCAVFVSPGQTSERQTVSGSLPPALARTTPLDRLNGTNELHLAIGLPLRNREALTNLLQQIYSPASPIYRRYLTPEQFAAQFGPTEADYQAVIDFAKANALAVTATHPNRVLLDVSGSVANLEKALHVTFRTFQHPTEARAFYAPDSAPSLELSTPILSIDGLDDYLRPHPKHTIRAESNLDNEKAAPKAGSGPSGNYMGDDFRAAYAPGVTLTGAGQTVGLLQFDGYLASDITLYETQAGLPKVPLQNVLVDGFFGDHSG